MTEEIPFSNLQSSVSFNKKRIFLNLSSFQMLAMFRRGLFYTFLSIYMRYYLTLSVTATTLYASIPMVLSSIFQMFVWGKLSDRLQRRRTFIILGEIIAGILLLFTYWIHAGVSDLKLAGYIIIIGLSIIEIFWSMSNISWSALVSDLYPSKERSRIMAQLTSIGGIGRIIGIFLGGMLYDGFFSQKFYEGWGFREGALFYIASIVMFLSVIPMFFVPEGGINTLKQSESYLKHHTNNSKKIKEELSENQLTNEKDSSYFLKIFIIFIISLVFINFGRNSTATIYSQYLKLPDLFSQNIGSEMISYIANVRSFATIIMGMLVGILKRKLGISKLLLLGIILAIVFLGLTTFASLQLIFIGSLFAGISEVIIMASTYEYAAALIPEEKRAKLFGIYNATFFLSWGLAGTLIIGPVVDAMISIGHSQIYSYKMAFYLSMIITAIGFGIFLGLSLYRKKEEKKS
ncbi:MFS transporter [Candidatus Harpocratesius sp.]